MKAKLTYILLACVLVLMGSLLYAQVKTKKIGYVTTLKVYEEFAMKKELENDYKKFQMARQSYLDSIKLHIQTLSLRPDAAAPELKAKLEQYKRAYVVKESQFNKEDENRSQQYNEQIWKQLNQFMADFGKERGYDYLLGASGQGSIMYANENEDVTKQAIEYVNAKYHGKKSK